MAGCPAIVQVNRRKSKGKSSRYFGVYYYVKKQKYKDKIYRTEGWRAIMRQNGKQVFLGFFKNEYDAATMYILSASIYYGQPVRVNDVVLTNKNN